MSCAAVHPERPELRCELVADHRDHGADSAGEWVQWPNDAFEPDPPPEPAKRTPTVRQIANRITRSESVFEERFQRADEATGAVEPEFVFAWLQACRVIAERLWRFNVDDVWNLLDAMGIKTAHESGARGLMLKAVKAGICTQVAVDDPDATRTSTRSAKRGMGKREVVTYQSCLISEPAH